MKPKHDGLFSVLVALAALVAAAAYGVLNHPVQMGHLLSARLSPLPDVRLPDAAALQRMEQLERRIGRLSQPGNLEPAPVDLALFGYRPFSLKAGGRHAGQGIADQAEPNVSMAFFSASKRFCIIDGTYYPENAQLPDGSRIAKVEARRVLIVRNGVKKWISVTGRSKPQPASGT
jgi:hypothetical protein